MTNNKTNFLTGIVAASALVGLPQAQGRVVAPSAGLPIVSSQNAELARLTGQSNELFDLTDPQTKAIYDQQIKFAQPKVISRDTTSYQEIENRIERLEITNPKDKKTILFSGAYVHFVGALVTLSEKYNIDYIPIPGMALSTKGQGDFSNEKHEPNPDWQKALAPEELQVQMRRILNAIAYIAKQKNLPQLKTMEDVRLLLQKRHQSNKPTLTVIALGETGHHEVYNSGKFAQAQKNFFETALKFMSTGKNQVVCHIGENLGCVDTSDLKRDKPLDNFLLNLIAKGNQIKFGAYGVVDQRTNLNGYMHIESLRLQPTHRM